MSNSKRPIPIGDELRSQIEGHIDDLVNSEGVELPPGKRIRFDLEGIPNLVDVPYPAISKRRITQIIDHISSNLFDRSVEWGVLFSELNHLRNDEAARAGFTHQQIWEKIQRTQSNVEIDWGILVSDGPEMRDTPESVAEINCNVWLPQLVIRLLGQPTGRDRDEDERIYLMKKMERDHHGLFLLVDFMCQLYGRANANPSDQHHLAKLGAHCLETLAALFASKDPENDMDHEVFWSLKERVEAISHGNREASPEVEVEDKVEDESEDKTEDGTEN
ncbi:hypothetical protein NCS52_00712000 [Fusarium sp. LHS14.1]|nr:hypothetical protein NCS52_00712000 [Fusarium sp. LHS14.1]